MAQYTGGTSTINSVHRVAFVNKSVRQIYNKISRMPNTIKIYDHCRANYKTYFNRISCSNWRKVSKCFSLFQHQHSNVGVFETSIGIEDEQCFRSHQNTTYQIKIIAFANVCSCMLCIVLLTQRPVESKRDRNDQNKSIYGVKGECIISLYLEHRPTFDI